jgi:hypothetical protein
MGLFSFGPSKQERQEMAARAETMAAEEHGRARAYKTQADEVRERERTAVYKDPEATRVIAGHLDANARIAAANARDLTASAEQLRKPWWR